MSSKNKKSTKKRRADQEAAASYETNSSMFATDLTVPQLQQVLIGRGVAASELKKLKKAELVQRVQATGSAAQRVSAALDSRASEAEDKHHSSDFFSRLGTALVVHIAQFLELGSLASTARVSRFLRLRLSLSLKGTPSHALARLRQLSLNASQCTKTLLPLLFARAQSLQSLKFQWPLCDISLPSTLRELDLTTDQPAFVKFNILRSLHECRHLVSLTLTVPYTNQTLPLPAAAPWPQMRTMSLDVPSVVAEHLLSCTPALQSLTLANCDVDCKLFSKVSSLASLSLVDMGLDTENQDNPFAALTSLQELSMDGSGILAVPTIDKLPPSLTRLHFDCYSVIGTFAAAVLPNLHDLSINNDLEELTIFFDKGAQLPQLHTFKVYVHNSVVEVDRCLALLEKLLAGGSMPNASVVQLQVHFTASVISPPDKQTKRNWRQQCQQIIIAVNRPALQLGLSLKLDGLPSDEESTRSEKHSEMHSETLFP